MRLLELPDACRDAGIEPVLVDGWVTRGVELTAGAIKASLDHHTAGARLGYIPSLKTLIYGRPDLAGPLCQGGAPRAADGDNKIYIIASGRANHAGAGSWNGATGNSSSIGLERELVGDGSDLTPWRNEMSIRWHTAICTLLDLPAKAVCRHAEFALPKGRKPDTRGVDGDWLRDQVQARLSTPAPPGDDDVPKRTYAAKATKNADGTFTAVGPVYLVALGEAPTHVTAFKDVEYHANREGLVLLPPPADGKAPVKDAQGTVRDVMALLDGGLYGI